MVPPGGAENCCHGLDHSLQSCGEPWYAASHDEHDGVGVAELVIQHLCHLLYELNIAVGGVAKARGVDYSKSFSRSEPCSIPDFCF